MSCETFLNILSMANIDFSFVAVNDVCVEGHLLKVRQLTDLPLSYEGL